MQRGCKVIGERKERSLPVQLSSSLFAAIMDMMGYKLFTEFTFSAPKKRINIYIWDSGRLPYGKSNGKVWILHLKKKKKM